MLGSTSTGYRYSPATDQWTETGAGLSARGAHSAVWTGSEMIVWGGQHSATFDGDGARYDPVPSPNRSVG